MTNGGLSDGDRKKMIILLTNSLGLSSTNNLYLADRYAKEFKCTVAVPDLFDNDPITTGGAIYDPSETSASPSADGAKPEPPKTLSFLTKVKTFAVSTVKGFLEDMWSARHTFSHTLPLLQDSVSELLGVYRPKRVAVIGYSFGAKYVLHLLTQAPPDLPAGYDPTAWTASDDALRQAESGDGDEYENIMCGVVIHPSLLDPQDFSNVVKPVHIIHSKDDELLPQSLLNQGMRALNSSRHQKGVINQRDCDVDITCFDNKEEQQASNNTIPPLPHGFAVPGDYPERIVGNRPEEVIKVVTDWTKLYF